MLRGPNAEGVGEERGRVSERERERTMASQRMRVSKEVRMPMSE